MASASRRAACNLFWDPAKLVELEDLFTEFKGGFRRFKGCIFFPLWNLSGWGLIVRCAVFLLPSCCSRLRRNDAKKAAQLNLELPAFGKNTLQRRQKRLYFRVRYHLGDPLEGPCQHVRTTGHLHPTPGFSTRSPHLPPQLGFHAPGNVEADDSDSGLTCERRWSSSRHCLHN